MTKCKVGQCRTTRTDGFAGVNIAKLDNDKGRLFGACISYMCVMLEQKFTLL